MQTKQSKPLSDRQDRFCQEFLVDCNASAAARRAGYSKHTAGSQGFDLLKKPEIDARISELMTSRSERTEVTADRVVSEFAHIAFARVTDALEVRDGVLTLKKLEDLTDSQKACISRIKPLFEKSGKDSDGSDETGDSGPRLLGYEVWFHDKQTALAALYRHTGGKADDGGVAEGMAAVASLILGGLEKQRMKKSKK